MANDSFLLQHYLKNRSEAVSTTVGRIRKRRRKIGYRQNVAGFLY